MPTAFQLKRYGASEGAFSRINFSNPAPQRGQLLIETEYFGLNFADVLARRGLYREAPALPYVPGYDLVGRVIAVGEGVSEHWMNKRVAALTRFGAYASHVATPETGCVIVPEDMPPYAACALGTQYCTAYYSAHYVANVHQGENVLVHAAAGGVGTALVQLLKHHGCRVFATAGSDEKVNALRALGVEAFNYRTTDYAAAVRIALNGERLDASFNSIAGTTFKKDMRLLGAGGRLVLYGFAERSGRRGGKWATLELLWNMGLVMPILLMATSKSIVGVNMLKIADHRPRVIGHCLAQLVELWKQGVIAPVNGGTFEAHELASAHALLESRATQGKLVVRAPHA